MPAIESLLTEAKNLESSGHFAQAVSRYTQVLATLRDGGEDGQEQTEREIDLLYRRATAHRFQGELDQALPDFERCAALAEGAGSLQWAARAHRALAEVFLRQKQIDVAIQSFRRSAELGEQGDDPADVLLTKSRLARALCEAGQTRDAKSLAGEIVEGLRDGLVPDHDTRAEIASQTYLSLGVACFKSGQGRRARRFFLRALEHLDPQRFVLPLAECRRYLGILESEAKNFMQATAALAEALKVYTRLGFDPGRFDAYLSLGITYMDMGDLRNARLCFQCAEGIARSRNMRAELARNQSRFADLEVREGKYDSARRMYEEDLRLTEQTSDRQGLGYCHRNLARVCLSLKDYRACERHAQESRDHFRASNRLHLAALSELALAECYLDQGRLPEAARLIEEAQHDLEGKQAVTYQASLADLRARLLMAEGKEAEAIEHFDAAIDGHLRQPPTRELAETRYQAALACHRAQRPADALNHLRNAVELAEMLGSRDIREKALRTMDDIDVVEAQRLKLAPYLPSGTVDELSTDWLDIDRRKEPIVATVMFVDMRGFTSLSGRLDEHELADTVEAFISLVVRIVRHNGGSVDKFIGDCVMATFGFGQTPEQGARMALWTGLEVLEQLAVTSEVHVDAGARPMHGSIGINTGQVITGCFGPLDKRDYTVVGYHVNLAARLQSLAAEISHPDPNRLILSDQTLRLAPGIAAVREIEKNELLLKGIDASTLTAWLVTGRA